MGQGFKEAQVGRQSADSRNFGLLQLLAIALGLGTGAIAKHLFQQSLGPTIGGEAASR
jgi:hypothetical protein